MLLVVVTGANAAGKLTVGTRLYMHGAGLAGEIKTPADASRAAARKSAAKGALVQCFVSADGKTKTALRNMGAHIHGQVGSLLLASVSADRLADIAEVQGVAQVDVAKKLTAFTDSARSVTHVDKVWNGASNGLPSNYDGTGVVIGVIDTGIDFTHPAFKDASGKLRIKSVYMPDASSGGVYPVVDGDTLPGRSYVTEKDILNLGTDTKSADHGTHTTGTAAGTLVNKYGGMAPGSEIVLGACGDNLSNVNIAASALYIAEYAKHAGKPCVISISLGSLSGPHDGTSALPYIYDQIAKSYGAVIVIAAGNSADEKVYLGKTVTVNSTVDHPSLGTVIMPKSGYENTALAKSYHCVSLLDVWNNNSRAVSAQAVILDSKGNPVWKSSMLTGSYTEISGRSFSDYFGSGSSIVSAGLVEDNGRFHLQIQSLIANSDALTNAYSYAVLFYGKDGDVIDVYESYGSEYTDLGTMPSETYDLTEGVGKNSESDDVTGSRTISVGALGSRLKFPYGTDNPRTVGLSNYGFKEGDIAYFSSYGTDYNGQQHPFVAAPGHTVVASVNHYSSRYTYKNSSQKVTQDGKDYYWAYMSGTSMATPVTSGIMGLWLQANNTLKVDDIKRIIKETAIHDQYTDGENKERFGVGKIDAFAGLAYITKNMSSISTNLLRVDFGHAAAKTEVEKTITVRGTKLSADVNVALVDSDKVFSVEPTVLKLADLAKGVDVKVKFAPRKAGNYTGKLVFSSEGVNDLVVELNAVGESAGIVMLPADTAQVTTNSFVAKWNDGNENDGSVSYTLLVNKQGNPLKLVDADFSGFTSTKPTDISAVLADSVPELTGWQGKGVMTVAGSLLLNGKLTSDKLGGFGESGKVTVKLCGKSYNAKAFGNATMTITTSLGSEKVVLGRTDKEYSVVLDAANNYVLSFSQDKGTAQLAWLKVYVGEADATQADDSHTAYRKVTGIKADNYKVDGLADGTAYSYTVRSVSADGNVSGWSNMGSVTTKKAACKTLTLAEIATAGEIGKNYKVADTDLVAVYANDSIIIAKDNNGYARKDTLRAGQTDFVKAMKLQNGDYDQSNWVAIKLPQGTKVDSKWIEDLKAGKSFKIDSVGGALADALNLTIEATAAPKRGDDTTFVPNTMIPANFIGTQKSAVSGKEYFFVTPKPWEVVTLTWAKWDSSNHRFMQPEQSDTTNYYGLKGGAYASLGHVGGEGKFVQDHTYQFRALVVRADFDVTNSADMSYDYCILPLETTGDVKDLSGVAAVKGGKTVVGVTYYNVAGMAASKPFDGVNIMETRFSDGSRTVVKKLK